MLQTGAQTTKMKQVLADDEFAQILFHLELIEADATPVRGTCFTLGKLLESDGSKRGFSGCVAGSQLHVGRQFARRLWPEGHRIQPPLPPTGWGSYSCLRRLRQLGSRTGKAGSADARKDVLH